MRKRGRPFGTRDFTKRVRSQNISSNTKKMAELHLLKVLSLEQDFGSWTINDDICSLFTLTRAFAMWFHERGADPLNKKLNDWLRKLRPALDDSFMFLFPFSEEFKEKCNSEQIIVLETLAESFRTWILDGALPDFFTSDMMNTLTENEQDDNVLSRHQDKSDQRSKEDVIMPMPVIGTVDWYRQMRMLLILKGKENLNRLKMMSQRDIQKVIFTKSSPLLISLSSSLSLTSRSEEDDDDDSNELKLSSHSDASNQSCSDHVLTKSSSSSSSSGDDYLSVDGGWCGHLKDDDDKCKGGAKRKNKETSCCIHEEEDGTERTLFVAKNNMLQCIVDHRSREWNHLKREVEKQLHGTCDKDRAKAETDKSELDVADMNLTITNFFNMKKSILKEVMLYGHFVEALVSILDVLKKKRRRITRELPDELAKMLDVIDSEGMTHTMKSMKTIVSSVVPNAIDQMCQTVDSRLHSALPPHVFVSLQDYILSGNRYPSTSAMTVITGVSKP